MLAMVEGAVLAVLVVLMLLQYRVLDRRVHYA